MINLFLISAEDPSIFMQPKLSEKSMLGYVII